MPASQHPRAASLHQQFLTSLYALELLLAAPLLSGGHTALRSLMILILCQKRVVWRTKQLLRGTHHLMDIPAPQSPSEQVMCHQSRGKCQSFLHRYCWQVAETLQVLQWCPRYLVSPAGFPQECLETPTPLQPTFLPHYSKHPKFMTCCIDHSWFAQIGTHSEFQHFFFFIPLFFTM